MTRARDGSRRPQSRTTYRNLGRVVAVLALLTSGTVCHAYDLVGTGTVALPVCGSELVGSAPSGFTKNVMPSKPNWPGSQCMMGIDGKPTRPEGHIALFGPAGGPGAWQRLERPGYWKFENLVADTTFMPLVQGCVPKELASRPLVMACNPNVGADGVRRGLSYHDIRSLHDADTPLATLESTVNALDTAPLWVDVQFWFETIGPNLGEDFQETIRDQFVLRVSVRKSGTIEYKSRDYHVSLLDQRDAQRIVASVAIAEDSDVKAEFLFAASPVRRTVVQGGNSRFSTDIKLRASITTMGFRRGIPAASASDAVRDNDIGSLSQLINAGADLQAPEEDGLTPLALAYWMNRRELIDLLEARGAADNRAAAIQKGSAYLSGLMLAGMPPEPLINDIFRSRLVVPLGEAKPAEPPAGATDPSVMRFDIRGRKSANGCEPEDVSMTIDGSAYQQDKVSIYACQFTNEDFSWGNNTSKAVVHPYLLRSRAALPGEIQVPTVFEAEMLSGAWGGTIYTDVWPFGSNQDRTANIQYEVTGTVRIPKCTNLAECSRMVVWVERFHDVPDMSDYVEIAPAGRPPTPLLVGARTQVDLTAGPADIVLHMSRSFQHRGSECCERLMQRHLVRIYVDDRAEVLPTDYLLSATHSPKPGETVDWPLAAARSRSILRTISQLGTALPPIVMPPPGPPTDRSNEIYQLARTHAAESHPFLARHADIYLRLALIDGLLRDTAQTFTASERAALTRVQRALTQTARDLYLGPAHQDYSAIRERAIGLHLSDARDLIDLLTASQEPALSEKEQYRIAVFLHGLDQADLSNVGALIAQIRASPNRIAAVAGIESYVVAAQARHGELRQQAESLKYELAQLVASAITDVPKELDTDFSNLGVITHASK